MTSRRQSVLAACVLVLSGLALRADPSQDLARAGLNLPVPLTVREEAGVARVDEPVTTGVPFAPGVLPKGAPLALLDAAGTEVPLQTRVLAHWPDGSVKWVLLDFQASVPAGGAAAFSLVARAPTARPAKPVTVTIARPTDPAEEAHEPVYVDTGAVAVTLNRKAFDLLGSVRTGKTQHMAENGRGGLQLTDVKGTVRTTVANLAPGYALTVVEAGPLRTVLRAEGEMQATETDRIGFTCWYHFYAGKKYVRVFFTIRNLKGKAFTQTDQQHVQDLAYQRTVAKEPGNVSLEAVDLVLAQAAAPGSVKCVWGGQTPHTAAVDLSAAKDAPSVEDILTLYQDSSAGWTWQAGDGKMVDPILKANKDWMAQNAPNDKKNVPYWEYEPAQYKALTDKQNYVGCTFRGYRFGHGCFSFGQEHPQGGGAALLTAMSPVGGPFPPLGQGDRAPGWAQLGTTTVGLRWFWQMYPKSLTLCSDGSIRVGLWPKEWSSPHVFEGTTHKTHELLFAFDDVPGAEAAEKTFTRFCHPLLALAPKEYYCATGAFNGCLMPEDRADFPHFEDWALTAVKCGVNPRVNPAFDSSLAIEREKYDQFGVWHFGDTSKRGWRGFGQYLELDIPYCLIAHFARTLNRAFFDEGEIHVRQLMDVPAHGGGYGHQKGESSHYYTTGSLLYYYLTGLDFIRESILESHNVHAKPAPWHARSFAITMWSNLDLYRAFGEQSYLDACRADLRWFLGNPQRPAQDPVTGFRPYGQTNFQEFMLGMMMDALGRYGTEFPAEQEWRDRLVALSNATMRTHAQWKQDASCCNGHAYAYLFTGRDRHLDFASQLMDASMPKDDPRWPAFRTGTGSGKYWSEFGHRLTQTLMWARWYRLKNGTPKPPAPITDLAATRAGDALELTWTAPAGDAGKVDHYVVKVAGRPLKDDLATAAEGASAANWWTTPPVKEVPPEPAAPGAKHRMTVAAPAGTCFVAIRSLRQVGPITAVSDLSNVVEVERSPHP